MVATGFDNPRRGEKSGVHAEGDTNTIVIDIGRVGTERVDGVVRGREEGITEVNQGDSRINGVFLEASAWFAIMRWARAIQSDPTIHILDGFEVGENQILGESPEITPINRITSTLNTDIPTSRGGQGVDIPGGAQHAPISVFICVYIALDCGALLEVQFALGDIVAHGDRDRMGGVGLNGVVESDDLEPRDRVERESSRVRCGEIVYSGYCEEVRFNPGRERGFKL